LVVRASRFVPRATFCYLLASCQKLPPSQRFPPFSPEFPLSVLGFCSAPTPTALHFKIIFYVGVHLSSHPPPSTVSFFSFFPEMNLPHAVFSVPKGPTFSYGHSFSPQFCPVTTVCCPLFCEGCIDQAAFRPNRLPRCRIPGSLVSLGFRTDPPTSPRISVLVISPSFRFYLATPQALSSLERQPQGPFVPFREVKSSGFHVPRPIPFINVMSLSPPLSLLNHPEHSRVQFFTLFSS